MGDFGPGFIGLLDHLKYVQEDTSNGMTTAELIEYNKHIDAVYIHNTTAIEGNRLSLTAVKKLLKEPSFRMCIWGVTEREFDEVLNYPEVLSYRRSYDGEINLHFIKQLHKHIMTDILELPGEFRTHNNIYISGVDKLLTPADLIEDELQTAINDYYLNIKNGENLFEQAMVFHYIFEGIHPFLDGNGRTGREILNYMITNAGYPMMLFEGHRNYYLALLQCGDAGLMEAMVDGFAKILLRDYGIQC
jgi:Fic family protein